MSVLGTIRRAAGEVASGGDFFGAAASGIYVYRLVAGKETISRKLVLLIDSGLIIDG